jgi:hypothetical protein
MIQHQYQAFGLTGSKSSSCALNCCSRLRSRRAPRLLVASHLSNTTSSSTSGPAEALHSCSSPSSFPAQGENQREQHQQQQEGNICVEESSSSRSSSSRTPSRTLWLSALGIAGSCALPSAACASGGSLTGGALDLFRQFLVSAQKIGST